MGSHAQTMQALERANAIRFERARLKRELASFDRLDGLRRVAELVCDPPEALRTMTVESLLCACRRVRHQSAAKILRRCALRGTIQLGALSERQRYRLAAELLAMVENTRRKTRVAA